MSTKGADKHKIHKVNRRPIDDISDDEHQDDQDSKTNGMGLNVNQNKYSKNKPEVQQNAIDYSVFKLETKNCDGKMFVMELCVSLKRILEAYKYFQTLDTKNKASAAEEFREFIEDNYADDVSKDYQHLMVDHQENIHKICKIVKSQQTSVTSQPPTYYGLFQGLHFYLNNSTKTTEEAKEEDEKKEASKPIRSSRRRRRRQSTLLKEDFDKAIYNKAEVKALNDLSDEWFSEQDVNVRNLGIYLRAVIDGFKITMDKDIKDGYVKFGAYARIFCECMCIYLLEGDVWNEQKDRKCTLNEMINRYMRETKRDIADDFEDGFIDIKKKKKSLEDLKDLEDAMHFVRDITNRFVHSVQYGEKAEERFISDLEKQELFNQINFIARGLKEIMQEFEVLHEADEEEDDDEGSEYQSNYQNKYQKKYRKKYQKK